MVSSGTIRLFLISCVESWQSKCVRVTVCVCCVSQVDHDEDEDDGVVKYENCGDTSASVRLHWRIQSWFEDFLLVVEAAAAWAQFHVSVCRRTHFRESCVFCYAPESVHHVFVEHHHLLVLLSFLSPVWGPGTLNIFLRVFKSEHICFFIH